ncbi:hypothetical protein A3D84_03120 [Candidatus Woesebacteria bacterium RIFCSPHIGHO2_02_FULL_42_20]|uniref:NADP-dependent oxidoreductase domain-containing protein n=1 Tax=Candidatus Woesebacteria bacterium RIFCSPHIGHO2_12_FULL_41_24 TaxID=1802510 RepID=A0A1F8ARY8_9BACT|nr:MAG: hypothetical protein A2W15_03310 [Candidatus Woesebacteria bacterium RBG_16_41_13]OGM29383.1 MAG: hypothetical protein A2873_04565 [Candidatus Woesebacteria bacterium RIFCSPHIGHO2_01_FULL_42_80]OGM34832.1 MAG: hypothetical protein A3D84_03120 [Candidatus Woesebacteria bacterium RIFCSPHIGHO2_02_FULL_42_20]OGM54461.1 MAG: hypothetical protein A3E44_00155 [Candidatus Woesebacteria bacterium RIFCSPHIGHO2_12_FULL_41_24]OGM71773.1 MAG: hypothetical protein A3I55_00480 [Candidatus Woesebacteri
MINRNNFSKIGIGTWGIGGFAEHDTNNDDEKQIKALTHQLSRGMNFVEINFWNSQGHSVKLIKEAVNRSGVARDKLFLLQSIYNYYNPTIGDVKKEFELCLKTFDINKVDSIQFPVTAIKVYGFKPLVKLVRSFLDQNLARFASVTNFDLENLKRYHAEFGDKIFSHELHYSFEIRTVDDLGIIDFDNKNKIINVLYQPLRRNRTAKQNWPLLAELAKKYNRTQNQIILNWMTTKGMHPLVKSETIEHIVENLESLNFEMDKSEIKRINDFRPPNYAPKEVDWMMEGNTNKAFIHALPNIFDEEYEKVRV